MLKNALERIALTATVLVGGIILAAVCFADSRRITHLPDGGRIVSRYCYSWKPAFPLGRTSSWIGNGRGGHARLLEDSTYNVAGRLTERRILEVHSAGERGALRERALFDLSGDLVKCEERYEYGRLRRLTQRLANGTLESSGYFSDGVTLEDHRIVAKDGTVISAEEYSLGVLEKTTRTLPDGTVEITTYQCATAEPIKEVGRTLPDGRKEVTAIRLNGDRIGSVERIRKNGSRSITYFEPDGVTRKKTKP